MNDDRNKYTCSNNGIFIGIYCTSHFNTFHYELFLRHICRPKFSTISKFKTATYIAATIHG